LCGKSLYHNFKLVRHLKYRNDCVSYSWQGPISIAVLSSGEDFNSFLEILEYYYQCSEVDALLDELVTLHFVFHYEHLPNFSINFFTDYKRKYDHDCTNMPLALQGYFEPDWLQNNYSVPSVLLMNVAREHVKTHYVFTITPQLIPFTGNLESIMKVLRYNAVPKPQFR